MTRLPRWSPIPVIAGFLGLAIPSSAQTAPTLRILPEVPYIEEIDGDLRLNFDILIHNPGPAAWEITRIELRIRDGEGRLEQRKFLDARNGSGLQAIPSRRVEAGTILTIYNPFYRFEPWRRLGQLEYSITLRDDQGRTVTPDPVIARPVRYAQRVELVLPVVGPAMVWDGHDFYSHHRRQEVGGLLATFPELPDNPVRYAYDFSSVNERGELHDGRPERIEGWHAYGSPVRAPGAGVVVSVADHVADNRIVDGRLEYPPDLTPDDAALGNHVIIDHGGGEYSLLAHLLANSLEVRLGESVRQGQPVGRIGFSGDTGFHVHVHYQLMDSTSLFGARALPSTFARFRRIIGTDARWVDLGTVDTGEIVVDGN